MQFAIYNRNLTIQNTGLKLNLYKAPNIIFTLPSKPPLISRTILYVNYHIYIHIFYYI